MIKQTAATSYSLDFFHSWIAENGIYTTEILLEWIQTRRENTHVSIKKSSLSCSDTWFYDEVQGMIRNKSLTFFQITGLQLYENDVLLQEQPIILQKEIGYLGIICQKKDGILHFLMQAKIEPGNINHIQISPTIQATKSNFLQKHGGKKPKYLDFINQKNEATIIVDQLQSEQSSRFLGKRNRNMIILLPETTEIKEYPEFHWMTLGQIKSLMKHPNLVNMDTRTVLSTIPFSMWHSDPCVKNNLEAEIIHKLKDKSLFYSAFPTNLENSLPELYRFVNDYKMFQNRETRQVPIHQLTSWNMTDNGVFSNNSASFSVIYCDISIEGREVTHWTQPLLEANGKARFGLITTIKNGIRFFLIRCTSEIGCFDQMELGPTLQLESGYSLENLTEIEILFINEAKKPENLTYDGILSEEGGRFYHEENHNQILEISADQWQTPPEGFFWLDYFHLNLLNQVNNCLNIQLRNLLSLLEV